MDLELKQILMKYIEANDLTISFVARRTGIAQPNLYRWLHDENFMLSKQAIIKVKEFLNGDFLKSVAEVLEDGQEKGG